MEHLSIEMSGHSEDYLKKNTSIYYSATTSKIFTNEKNEIIERRNSRNETADCGTIGLSVETRPTILIQMF